MTINGLSGMQQASQMLDMLATTRPGSRPGAPSDLPDAVAHLITAHLAYDVNARVVGTQQSMDRALIDVVA